MRDFKLRVFAASGACTSAGANTLTVNTKSSSVALKRLIPSIGAGCAILSRTTGDEQETPSWGAATHGKSSQPSFTMRERIRAGGMAFADFLKDQPEAKCLLLAQSGRATWAPTYVGFEGKKRTLRGPAERSPAYDPKRTFRR